MVDYPDSFKDYPASVTEIKSDKTDDGSDWTPRDVLIAALRKLDTQLANGGKLPMALAVVWTDTGEGYGCSVSSPHFLLTRGMLFRAAQCPPEGE